LPLGFPAESAGITKVTLSRSTPFRFPSVAPGVGGARRTLRQHRQKQTYCCAAALPGPICGVSISVFEAAACSERETHRRGSLHHHCASEPGETIERDTPLADREKPRYTACGSPCSCPVSEGERGNRALPLENLNATLSGVCAGRRCSWASAGVGHPGRCARA
jgi:hypothetical protein